MRSSGDPIAIVPKMMINEKNTEILKRTAWEMVSFRNKPIRSRKTNFKFLYYKVEKETYHF